MAAVAEGAAIFAESVDWGSQRKGRKATRGSVSAGSALALSFNYIARTPDIKSKPVVKAQGAVAAGSEFQRSEEHKSELQSIMSNSYAVFCLKKKKNIETKLST